MLRVIANKSTVARSFNRFLGVVVVNYPYVQCNFHSPHLTRFYQSTPLVGEKKTAHDKRTIMSSAVERKTLEKLNFTNTALRELPVQEDKGSEYRLVR